VDGVWATKSEGTGLIVHATYVVLIQQRYGRTDRHQAISKPHFALVHRAVKMRGRKIHNVAHKLIITVR